ncbi:transcription elongation factor GreA [Chloroherpeton thalassium ATCC 35110]|uniref:Transcription elongation factor GreA n=1 Tax=Chloroherpeton thalassium (strain ATCC 35110 / GB-78) TaxID=517418 RepID=GREA_CHLT3|nr:transcription elongation factor GreA [Chloroherpeton thalassium]B3QV56.1 RecName: Full=Transcription elongation factor GreA; AltName: Full=Transcript cleavage factor GreA [Chloroherpeton thalassium ATCC 35110]ACF13010.1 transcription elongation factor GreA [Chloroherpeton thalassium ATCC 35110]
MSDKTYLTKGGYNKLKDELDDLKTNVRQQVLEKITEAKSHGDLSENAEYEAAKEEQAQVESRISTLERVLSTATILDEKDIKTDKVYILTTVLLKDLDRDEEVEYTLVSSEEADSENGKISVKSPIGKNLLGKSVGEIVEIKVPKGIMRYEVLNIKVK